MRHDATLKLALNQRRAPVDVVGLGSIKEKVDELKDEIGESVPGAESGTSVSACDSGAPEAMGPAVQEILKRVVPGKEDVVAEHQVMAERLVRHHVFLIAMPDTHEELARTLKDSVVGKINGSRQSTILVNYDVKSSGESQTHPHLRTVSLQAPLYKGMLGAALDARGGLPDGDVYLLWDAGRHGNERILASPFVDKKLPHEARRVYLHTSEKSTMARGGRAQGVGSIDQVEFVQVVTKSSLAVPEVQRKHYTATNHGNCMGPVELCEWGDAWHVPIPAKRAMLGSRRVAVGGPLDGGGTDNIPPEPIKNDMVPFSYHELPVSVYEEWLLDLNCAGVIDLTVSSGHFAMAAVTHHIPYVGICYSEQHKKALSQRLYDLVLTAMATAEHPLHSKPLAASFKDDGAIIGRKRKAQENAAAKGKAKAKGKGKAKAKGKNGEGGKGDSEGSESESDEDSDLPETGGDGGKAARCPEAVPRLG